MKLRAWVIGVASIGFVLALGALYVMRDLWAAKRQIDAWSQTKYESEPPATELPIEVVGRQFEWRARYPSAHRLQSDPQLEEHFASETEADQGQADDLHLVNELHTWKGAKVKVLLKSRDVLHSFFVPVMRLKQDAVPGKVTTVWLSPAESNVNWDPKAEDWRQGDKWEFACAEYGHGHNKMRGQLFVHETRDDFLKWLKRAQESR